MRSGAGTGARTTVSAKPGSPNALASATGTSSVFRGTNSFTPCSSCAMILCDYGSALSFQASTFGEDTTHFSANIRNIVNGLASITSSLDITASVIKCAGDFLRRFFNIKACSISDPRHADIITTTAHGGSTIGSNMKLSSSIPQNLLNTTLESDPSCTQPLTVAYWHTTWIYRTLTLPPALASALCLSRSLARPLHRRLLNASWPSLAPAAFPTEAPTPLATLVPPEPICVCCRVGVVLLLQPLGTAKACTHQLTTCGEHPHQSYNRIAILQNVLQV